jgi:hypothetical protein
VDPNPFVPLNAAIPNPLIGRDDELMECRLLVGGLSRGHFEPGLIFSGGSGVGKHQEQHWQSEGKEAGLAVAPKSP